MTVTKVYNVVGVKVSLEKIKQIFKLELDLTDDDKVDDFITATKFKYIDREKKIRLFPLTHDLDENFFILGKILTVSVLDENSGIYEAEFKTINKFFKLMTVFCMGEKIEAEVKFYTVYDDCRCCS